jgi:uncharacterized membrane protein YfcA
MKNNLLLALFWGALIGILGSLMGLDGAEFRLPILTFFFHLSTQHAAIVGFTGVLLILNDYEKINPIIS